MRCRNVLFVFLGTLLLAAAALADTTPSANCNPFPVTFTSGAGSNAVTCPPFTVAGATLTGVTLSLRADYQFGSDPGPNTVSVVFTPAGPAGVTWAPPSVTLQPTGGPSSGTEPTGSINATGGISAAAFAGSYNVNLSSSVVTGTVATSSGAVSVVYTYTPATPPVPVCTSLPGSGTIGTPYSGTITVTGGVPPYTFAITGGSLPPGLTLNTTTGAITGTPTTAGTYTFTVKVTDSIGQTGSTSCTITIPTGVSPSCTSLPGSGTVGTPYTGTLTASGGVPPYTFAITSGSLPPGLTLNTTTGAVTGTPTVSGAYTFTVKVTDSIGQTGSSNCTISIGAPPTGTCNNSAATIAFPATGPVPENAFLIRYAANLDIGDSFVNITNYGLNGAPLLGPGFGSTVGDLCVNIYTFAPDEELLTCCSCAITPNGLATLSVNNNLLIPTLIPITPPSSAVIKLVASIPGTTTLAGGIAAWGSTVHRSGTNRIGETPFTPGTLSSAELASITGRCASILGNGSGFGICSGCRALIPGGGAAKQ